MKTRERQPKIDLSETARRASERMDEIGMIPADVERLSGVGRSIIDRLIAGDGIPSSANLFPISDTLQIAPRWLLYGIGPKEPPPDADDADPGQAIALLDAYRSLDPKKRDLLVEVALALMDNSARRFREMLPGPSVRMRSMPSLQSPAAEYRGPPTSDKE